MTASSPGADPASQRASFHAEGRTVDAGRGWGWIADAFALFRRQPGMWILIVLASGIVLAVIGMIPGLGSLASALLFPVLGAGLMLGCREQDQGGTLEFEHLFAGFKRKTGELVLVGVFNLACGVIVIFVFAAVVGGGVFMGVMRGGLQGAGLSLASMLIGLLLVAGLLVPVSMAAWFAPALIMLHDLAPAAALKASFFACLANWMPFLVYSVVLLALCLVAAIPLGLGYLVLFPVLTASVYTAYRDIFCAG
jgi:uncharacterized membrane protein